MNADKALTGGTGREVLSGSNGQARHAWPLYAACPRWPHPFRRAEYQRTAGEACGARVAR